MHITSVWFMPSGDEKESMLEYNIDYCATTFDELYEILEKWSKEIV